VGDLIQDFDILEATNYLLSEKHLEKVVMENLKKFKLQVKQKLESVSATKQQ
jgi:hypothetical protein